jgi:A/G-specific adenine glycosylase
LLPSTPLTFTSSDIRLFRAALLRWFTRHRRSLPWRESRDPYRIWISEIMLQQTRVGAVLERYNDFLRRFPDVNALATAKPQDVLAAWSGLGYYRRARALHRAARIVVRDHAGEMPVAAAALLSLPGIGRYTAAAIASIAFQEPCAVVDGNVERVLRRLLAWRRDPLPRVWDTAQQLLSPRAPGNFNQAMMELGATVCLPSRPRCDLCPVRRLCATGRPSLCRPGKLAPSVVEEFSLERPAKPPRKTAETTYALAVRDSRVYLVRRRRGESLMPGMWELPQLPNGAPPNGALPSPAFGGCGHSGAPAFTLRHSITVTDHVVHVRRVSAAGQSGGRWILLPDAADLPLTGLARKILRRAALV